MAMARKERRLQYEADLTPQFVAYYNGVKPRLKAWPPQSFEDLTQRNFTQLMLNSRIEVMTALKPAFPSSPQRPPEHTVYFTRGDIRIVIPFGATYSAKKFIASALDDEPEAKWKDEFTLKAGDITIRCEPGLEHIMEYKLTPQERAWQLPSPYTGYADIIRTGKSHKIPPSPAPSGIQYQKGGTLPGDTKTKTKAKSSTPQEKSSREPRQSRDGLTSIADICATLKIEPRVARAILRKSNTPKPPHGWAWDAKAAASITALIKKGLK
jgi:hypothetical protein